MSNHFITHLLGIKEWFVDVNHVEETKRGFLIELGTKVRRIACPSCKTKTKKVHGYRVQRIRGRLIEERRVELFLRKRRYKCTDCGHTFYEGFQFIDRYQRRTVSLNQQALSYIAEHSFTEAARLTGLSVSSLLRLFDKRKMPIRRQLPRVIAIDEFKGDADKTKFQTIIVDVEKKEIIEILPDRRVETLEKYFKSCESSRVEIVVMDMSKAFKKAVQSVFDKPLIIADRFHFMRHVYWALDSVRREIQHTLSKEHRLKTKRSKKLLWMDPNKLDEKGKHTLQDILQLHPDLKKAYELKNDLNDWFKTSDLLTARKGLETWFDKVNQNHLIPFKNVVKTYKNWFQEIVNAFMYPSFNNGYIEGVNNTTKVMKRISYGIKSFQRLRKKILLRQAIRSSAKNNLS